jgi:hypothetical protein
VFTFYELCNPGVLRELTNTHLGHHQRVQPVDIENRIVVRGYKRWLPKSLYSEEL